MPPVRARLLVLAGLLIAGLALSGVALGDNGGFAPAGPDSPNGNRIETVYWFVMGFAVFIFLVVEVALVFFIVKYRRGRRARDAEGPQIRGHLNLELAWTAVPVLILVAIAIFTFYELPGIKDVPAAGAAGSELRMNVEGKQFYWQITYPNGVIAIDTMRAPVNRPVRVEVTSPDERRDPQLVDPRARREDRRDPGPSEPHLVSRSRSRGRTRGSAPSSAASSTRR